MPSTLLRTVRTWRCHCILLDHTGVLDCISGGTGSDQVRPNWPLVEFMRVTSSIFAFAAAMAFANFESHSSLAGIEGSELRPMCDSPIELAENVVNWSGHALP